MSSDDQNEPIMATAAEIADVLRITVGTWRRWVRDGYAPAGHKLGPRAVRWYISDVEGWIADGRPWQGPRPLSSRRHSVFRFGQATCRTEPRKKRPCEMDDFDSESPD